jgi:hypothetical protein
MERQRREQWATIDEEDATLFRPTKAKMHGVWKFNNITPSHPSHPVDTYCTRPSMAVGWCLHRLLRRKRRNQKSTDFPLMAVCLCYESVRWEGREERISGELTMERQRREQWATIDEEGPSRERISRERAMGRQRREQRTAIDDENAWGVEI